VTIMQRIGVVSANREAATRLDEFYNLARTLVASKGDFFEMRKLAEQSGSSRVRNILGETDPRAILNLKAAATALSTSSGFADYRVLAEAFSSSLASIGLFDALLAGGALRIPVVRQFTAGSVASAIVAATVNEGSIKPISNMAFNAGTVAPSKSAGLIITSSEFAKMGGTVASTLIGNELKKATVAAVDGGFASLLLNGVSVAVSSGQTAEAARFDLNGMFALMQSDNMSKFFIVVSSAVCKSWAMMGSTSGNATPSFPNLTPVGGSISGTPVICSDFLGPTANVCLIDATGLVLGSSDISLDTLTEGSVQMDSAPDSPPTSSTNLISMWQMGYLGLRAERLWVARKNRSDCVQAVFNANSYQSGFSPP
jgi:hypothetical protein